MNSINTTQRKREQMEFQSKGKVHPCLGYHIPTLRVPTKQELHSMTWGSSECNDRSAGTGKKLNVPNTAVKTTH